MSKISLSINPQKETKKIILFLEETFRKQEINKAVLGLSGGIDSTVCYYLLKKTLPEKNIIAVHLPYFNTSGMLQNVTAIPIKTVVNEIQKILFKSEDTFFETIAWGTPLQGVKRSKKTVSSDLKIRFGNIMARIRMIILYDLAKKNNALVCGTENKSEHLLGYFTRFGDGASDVEPIRHLYKTQVYQLAEYLGVPKKIIIQKPTAGLWKNQTDEGQFGFTYKEADQVLHLYFDKKISTEDIMKMGYSNAKKIIGFAKKNEFKQKTPYLI